MRIVAGSARGRQLQGPKRSDKIRPTADRVRETVFNILGQFLEGQRVLDLFAGTGALAFEALSRGAGSAVLVDVDREALELCRVNAEALGFASQARILPRTVERALAELKGGGTLFDLIFADPPYAKGTSEKVTQLVADSQLLAPGGTFCLEHEKFDPSPEVAGTLTRTDQRRFGDTLISFYRIP